MENKIKNRDASDKYKGFRYQKIRLAKKMLELLREDKEANIIAIPEYKDDGYYVNKEGTEILEQNKEYSKNFTVNSDEIKKSVINFLDYYLQADLSKNIHFIFFTNVNYTNESDSEIIRDLDLDLLEKPVLEYLEEKNLTHEVILFVSKFFIEVYRKDYKIKNEDPNTYTINYERLRKMSTDEWKSFLNSIDFQFGQANLEGIEEEIEKDIRLCEFFTTAHLDKIENIKSRILDDIDSKMSQKNWIQRIINRDTIKLIYLECRDSQKILKTDGVHKMWNLIKEKYQDDAYRNLEEKIKAVTPNVSKKTIRRHNLSVVSGNISLEELDIENSNSLRVRVYQAMGKYFALEFEDKAEYTDNEISYLINEIQQYVIKYIEDLKEDFTYGVNNKEIIEELVLVLIDECFYAFDDK